jgi:hypothetical protein
MIVKRIINATRVLGAPTDWEPGKGLVVGLPICDVETPAGNFMVSAWEPTPEELAALNRGESLKLWIRGFAHPVVSLTVGELPK